MISKDLYNLYSILDLSQLPKSIKISTITLTCQINTTFDNKNIENFLDLDSDIVTIKSLDVNKSLLITKKRRKTKTKKSKKNAFYNQVSIGIKKECDINKKGIINIKLFINGSMQITGCKCIDDFLNTLSVLFTKLRVTKAIFDETKNIMVDKPFVGNIDELQINNIKNIKIAMINSNFNVGFSINREKLFCLLIDKNISCSYDPIIHACVNIKYNYDCKKKISIFVFEKGTVIITGVNNCDQILEAHKFINNYLHSNYSNIMKRSVDDNYDDILRIVKKRRLGIELNK